MIVVSPTASWLKTAFRDCASSLVVASPYIGGYFANALSQLNGEVEVTVLTRTLIADFASQASDLEAVCQIAKRSNGVFSLSSLHAKVYVVDEIKALVTSANATFSGMHTNRECGLEVNSPVDVKELSQLIRSGFGSVIRPKLWTLGDLEELREPVNFLKSTGSSRLEQQFGAGCEPTIKLSRGELAELVVSFSGWLRLTFEGVLQIQRDAFSMEDVAAACAPLIKMRYPNNRHGREKLRQQMQRLRDLGLVRFLGRGKYERIALEA